MPAVYLCNVTGTGTRIDPWKPQITLAAGATMQALAIESIEKKGISKAKAIVWSDDNAATGSGVILVATAADGQALLAALQSTNLTNPRRNTVNNWLTAAGDTTLPSGPLSLLDTLVFICAQIEPALDVATFISTH